MAYGVFFVNTIDDIRITIYDLGARWGDLSYFRLSFSGLRFWKFEI
jgi:hypothetical protein